MSWTITNQTNDQWYSITSDSTGQYLAACIFQGTIYTSQDYGNNWIESNGNTDPITKAPSAFWSSITSDTTGKYLAACVNNGSIYTSQDYGSNWIESSGNNKAPISYWSSITSDSTGQYLAACISPGTIYTSQDYGSNWIESNGNTGSTKSPNAAWKSITSNKTGQFLAACIINGIIYTSQDYGFSWNISYNSPSAWHSITSNDSGDKLAACIYNNNNKGIAIGTITLSPPDPCVSISTLTTYTIGDTINISWAGGYPLYTLTLYQNSIYVKDIGITSDTTYTWIVDVVGVYQINIANPNCERDSNEFTVINTCFTITEPTTKSYVTGEPMLIEWQDGNSPFNIYITDANGNQTYIGNTSSSPFIWQVNVVEGAYTIYMEDSYCTGYSDQFTVICVPIIFNEPSKLYYFIGDSLFIEWLNGNSPYTLTISHKGNIILSTTTTNTNFIWPINVAIGIYKICITDAGGCTGCKEFLALPLQDICFVKDTLVETDQGDIPIQSLIVGKHTIFNQKIIELTTTIHIDSHLVRIAPFAFGTYPTKETIVSQEHKS